MKNIEVIDVIKKDDIVYFLERVRKLDCKFFSFTIFGLFFTVALTSFFFTVLILSSDNVEKLYSLIVGSIGLVLSTIVITLLSSLTEAFYYTVEDWRAEPYDLCKEEYEWYMREKAPKNEGLD